MDVGRKEGVAVRAASTLDLPFAARLHEAELADGFFAALGRRFLRSYYRMFLLSPHGVVLVAEHEAGPVGILAGTTDDVSHFRWVTRSYWWRLAIVGATALVVRPRLLWRFARTRLRRYLRGALRLRRVTGDATASEKLGAPRVTATLTHIAVMPEIRGLGIGGALTDRYHQLAAATGAERLVASTRSDEHGATGFYRTLGWELAGNVRDVDGNAFDRLQLEL